MQHIEDNMQKEKSIENLLNSVVLKMFSDLDRKTVSRDEFYEFKETMVQNISEIKLYLDRLCKINEPQKNHSLLTKKQVIEMLQISPSTLQRWMKNEVIPYYKNEGRVYFIESEVMDALKKDKYWKA